MSRTHHLTRVEFADNSRPTRHRAKTRLTKRAPAWSWPNNDRPKNAGNHYGLGFNAGQRRRKEARVAKVLGRRLDRRRRNREVEKDAPR
jgi:hypothetical protein